MPFTETTLFTPRRCFERATKKCYDDSLSSIVASCSWDKYVVVGIGSQFDVLWDRKRVEFDQLNKDNLVQKRRLNLKMCRDMLLVNIMTCVGKLNWLQLGWL